jgi:octaprenyl-diphosphate synthase
VLDYTSDADTLGKNIGDDLAEGKPTLPLILSRRHLAGDELELIESTIREGGLDRIGQVVRLIRESGALDESMAVARQRAAAASQAIAALPDSPWKRAMLSLAAYSVARDH